MLREIPECRNIPFHLEPYATVIRLAKTIAGHPRHLGLHPCGIVLSRVPLHEVVPLQMTASGLPSRTMAVSMTSGMSCAGLMDSESSSAS